MSDESGPLTRKWLKCLGFKVQVNLRVCIVLYVTHWATGDRTKMQLGNRTIGGHENSDLASPHSKVREASARRLRLNCIGLSYVTGCDVRAVKRNA
jgi:hypothetical protein